MCKEKKINIGDREYGLLTSDSGYIHRLDSIFQLNNLLDSEEILEKELGDIIKEINSDDIPTFWEYHDIIKKRFGKVI